MLSRVIWILVMIFLVSTVAAKPVFNFEISDAFDMVGREMADILHEKWALFFFVVVIWTWILYLIIGIALEKVPHIGNSKKAKTISFAISLLAVISFMYTLNKNGGIDNILDTTLGRIGSILIIVLAIIGYNTFKGNQNGDARGAFGKSSLILGIIMLVVGWRYMNDPMIAGFGALAIVGSVVSWAGVPSARGSPYAHGHFSQGQKERWQHNVRNTIHNLDEDYQRGMAKGRSMKEWLKNLYYSEEKEKQHEQSLQKLEQLTESQIKEIYTLLRKRNADPNFIRDKIDKLIEYNQRITDESNELEQKSEYNLNKSLDVESEGALDEKKLRAHIKNFIHEYVKNLDGDKLEELTKQVEHLENQLHASIGKLVSENRKDSLKFYKTNRLAKKQRKQLELIKKEIMNRQSGKKFHLKKFNKAWGKLRDNIIKLDKINKVEIDQGLLREINNIEYKILEASKVAQEKLSEEKKDITQN